MSFTPGLGLTAYRPPTALGAGAIHNIFTVAGIVLLTSIVGRIVGTAMDATACTMKLSHTVGPTDICANIADIASDIVGTYYTITGTFANAMIARDLTTVPTAAGALMAAIWMQSGSIYYTTNFAQIGTVEWLCSYIPIAPGSSIVPA